MNDARPALLSLSLDATRALFSEWGESPVHAATLRRALLDGRAPHAEPNMSRALLERIDAELRWTSSRSVRRAPAPDGSEKHLVEFDDGEVIEAVRLPGHDGGAPSACVTSQVGCAMACRFCASGLDKVRRNVAAHELLEQVVHLRRTGPVRRLVFMGAGEPTQNLGALRTALDVLRDEAFIGPKKMMISTVGPPAAIDNLAALGRRFTLAVSLHSARHDVRADLIPTQTRVAPAELLDAADRYAAQVRKPYQVEYVLLAGVNDSDDDAAALARLLAGRRAHVSAIRWNRVPGMPFEAPSVDRARTFVSRLHAADVSARLRQTVGGEESAACGQLRSTALRGR